MKNESTHLKVVMWEIVRRAKKNFPSATFKNDKFSLVFYKIDKKHFKNKPELKDRCGYILTVKDGKTPNNLMEFFKEETYNRAWENVANFNKALHT
jgi:hypothetical protein